MKGSPIACAASHADSRHHPSESHDGNPKQHGNDRIYPLGITGKHAVFTVGYGAMFLAAPYSEVTCLPGLYDSSVVGS
jgi:hypothetical protein